MSNVFLAFASDDRNQVDAVLERLEGAGYTPFADGAAASDVDVNQAVAQTACTIVLWSVTSTNDEPVRTAAQLAKSQGKLIPAFIEQTFPAFGYGLINGVHLEDWNGSAQHPIWRDLVERIDEHIQEAQATLAPPAPPAEPAPSDEPGDEPGAGANGQDMWAPPAPRDAGLTQPSAPEWPLSADPAPEAPMSADNGNASAPVAPEPFLAQPTAEDQSGGGAHAQEMTSGGPTADADAPALFSSPDDLPPLPPIDQAGGPERAGRPDVAILSQLGAPMPMNPIAPRPNAFQRAFAGLKDLVARARTNEDDASSHAPATPDAASGRLITDDRSESGLSSLWSRYRTRATVAMIVVLFVVSGAAVVRMLIPGAGDGADRPTVAAADAGTSAQTQAATATTRLTDSRADDQAFAAARASGTPAAYRAYLTQRPDGRHAPAARAAIARLSNTDPRAETTTTSTSPAASSAASAPATADTSATPQAEITSPEGDALGAGDGGAQGARPSQADTDDQSTDFASAPVDTLAGDDDETDQARRAAERRQLSEQDDALWRIARDYRSIEGYQAYLLNMPNGRYADEARDALAELDARAAQAERDARAAALARAEENDAAAQNALDASDPAGGDSVLAGGDGETNTPTSSRPDASPEENVLAGVLDTSTTAAPSTNASAPSGQAAPYDAEVFDPYIAIAILDARDAAAQAREAEGRAEAAAVQAREAALLAEQGQPGHRARAMGGGLLRGVAGPESWYRGEWRRGQNGAGCERRNIPELIPDDVEPQTVFWDLPGYCGNWTDGQRQGFGVYIDVRTKYVYRGGWTGDDASGYAVVNNVYIARYPDQVNYSGQVVEGRPNGAGRIDYPDGRRFEGRVVGGAPNGFGVMWSKTGTPISVGRWRDGVFAGDDDGL